MLPFSIVGLAAAVSEPLLVWIFGSRRPLPTFVSARTTFPIYHGVLWRVCIFDIFEIRLSA